MYQQHRRFALLALLLVILLISSSPALALPLADEVAPEPLDLDALQAFWLEAYGASSRTAQFGGPSFPLDAELLAKAEPDECYDGIGQPYPPGPACETGQAKVNQAYVWGLTRPGSELWFGTGANVHCLMEAGYYGIAFPYETPSYVWSSATRPFRLPCQTGSATGVRPRSSSTTLSRAV